MPTVLRIGPYRFFFYAGDRNEPPQIHVEHDNNTAKFWLNPVRLEKSRGLNRQEINQLERIVRANQEQLLESWNEYFND
jgi:hypothetical protein